MDAYQNFAITDELYYFATEPARPAGSVGAATMAYFDGPAIDFWSGLRHKEQPSAAGSSMLDPKGPMATELLRQIVAVHDLKQTPPILSAGFMNWVTSRTSLAGTRGIRA